MPKLSDQGRKRAANRYAILRSVHLHGARQRVVLSRELLIRKSSVTSITAEAVAQGVIVEDDPRSLRTTLSLNTKQNCVAVARVGIHEIESARVTLDGDVEAMRTIAFEPGASAKDILTLIELALRTHLRPGGKRVLGVGVADLGVVDPTRGVTRFAANLPQWRDVPVREELQNRLGIGVHVDSDVRSQLFGAAWFGRHLSNSATLFYVGLLEGVAGALIMNGRAVLGRNFTAGEFGHIRAGDEGRPCGCGKKDCLETYASLPALHAAARAIRPGFAESDDTGEQLAELAESDEKIAVLLRDVAGRIARVVAPILATLDPDALVFGAPGERFTHWMGQAVHERLVRDLAGLGRGRDRVGADGGRPSLDVTRDRRAGDRPLLRARHAGAADDLGPAASVTSGRGDRR